MKRQAAIKDKERCNERADAESRRPQRVLWSFRRSRPPDGVEIVSYNIVMGIGHIITLRLPPDKLREVNLAFEHGVWGAFRTEFYPTYDYLKVFYDMKQKDSESGTTNPGGKGPENEKKPAESEKSPIPQKKQKKSSQ